jgi:hypothetical protein
MADGQIERVCRYGGAAVLGTATRLAGVCVVGFGILISGLVLLARRDSIEWQLLPRQPATQAGGDSDYAHVGDAVKLQGWEVTLLAFGPYDLSAPAESPSDTPADIMLADVRIRNIQSRTSEYRLDDFALMTGDGRRVRPDRRTASVDGGVSTSETVQPLEVSERRVLFDVPARAGDLVLEVLEVQFRVPAPGSS